MDDVYENIHDYNSDRKILIAFDDMIADIMTNKKSQISKFQISIHNKRIIY